MRTRAGACSRLAFALLTLALPWPVASGPPGFRTPLAGESIQSPASFVLSAVASLQHRIAPAAGHSASTDYPLILASIVLIAGGLLAMRRSKPRLDPELRYLADKSARIQALARAGQARPADLMHLSALDSRGQWWRIAPNDGTWQCFAGGSWRPVRNPTRRWRSLQLAGLFLVLAGLGTVAIALVRLTGIAPY